MYAGEFVYSFYYFALLYSHSEICIHSLLKSTSPLPQLLPPSATYTYICMYVYFLCMYIFCIFCSWFTSLVELLPLPLSAQLQQKFSSVLPSSPLRWIFVIDVDITSALTLKLRSSELQRKRWRWRWCQQQPRHLSCLCRVVVLDFVVAHAFYRCFREK